MYLYYSEYIYIYILIFTYMYIYTLCEQADSGLPRESHSSSCLFCSLVSRLAADATNRANSQAQWLEPKPIDSAQELEPKYNELTQR